METVKAARGVKEISALFHQINKRGGWIAGGYAAWAAAPVVSHVPGDVDVFTKNNQAFDSICGRLYDDGYHLVFDSATAATYQNPLATIQTIQVVVPRDYKTGLDVIADFDFSVSQAVYLTPSKLAVGEFFLEDVEARRLRILRVNNPVFAVRRITKYVSKGYSISPDQVAKLFKAYDAFNDADKSAMIQSLGGAEEWQNAEDFSEYESYDDDNYLDYSWY